MSFLLASGGSYERVGGMLKNTVKVMKKFRSRLHRVILDTVGSNPNEPDGFRNAIVGRHELEDFVECELERLGRKAGEE
jgi:hypothetical protein